MGNLNFQDVIRDVHDPTNHALQISGTISTAGQATVSLLGTPTVMVGTPTLYAVVNTSAAGVGNSIVTINPRVDYIGLMSVSGNVNVGTPTVFVGTPTLYAVVNTGGANTGNITLNPGPNQIGSVTVSNPVSLGSGVANIGFATVAVSTPTLYAVVNTAAAGQASVVLDNSLSKIGFATVYIAGGSGTQYTNEAVVASPVGTVAMGWDGANVEALTTDGSGRLLTSVVNINAEYNSDDVAGPTDTGPAILAVRDDALTTLTPVDGDYTQFRLNSRGAVWAGLDSGISNIGFATVAVSNATLYAVVNTSAAGVGNSMVTINPRTDYFGLVSVSGNVAVSSLPALVAGVAGIGFATVNVVNQPALVASSANIGSVSVLGGTIKLDTNTLNIGSVSVLGGVINANLNTGTLNIGSVSVLGGTIGVSSLPALVASTVNIGSVSVLGGVINTNINTGTLNIGSVSILGGTLKLAEPNVFIGLVTSVNGAGTQFIGLVTAWSRNAGTSKTLIPLPVGLGNNSLATVAVPTNANKINLTQLILNSNVTTEIAIKSGVTYLTGNASLGVTLFPGGGFVMNGSPDSPVWISLPSGAMVIEKRDGGGTVSKIGGHVIYFDE